MPGKLPPPLPPRVSKGIVLQSPSYSSDEEEEEDVGGAEAQVNAAIAAVAAQDRPRSNAPARPPRPANFTVPPEMQQQNATGNAISKEEEDRMLTQMTAKPKPASEDPNSITYEKAERATKFTYNAAAGKWEMKTTRVRLARDWFSEGGMRLAYRAVEVPAVAAGGGGDDAPPQISYVIKLFKNPETKPAVVFHEALTQAVSERYAQGFNNLCERKDIVLRLRFLPVWVLHLTQRSKLINGRYRDLYATMEPYLPGKYVKLSDNSGRHLNDIPAQAAQTFSHYSFLASNRRLVCVDIQGVSELVQQDGGAGEDGGGMFTAKNMTLTDPQIHSIDGNLFGAGNLGIKGINAFITSYKRTMFDEQLGLAHLTSAHLLQDKTSSDGSAQQQQPASASAQDKAGAPPFDTAELASILAADERARVEEEEMERREREDDFSYYADGGAASPPTPQQLEQQPRFNATPRILQPSPPQAEGGQQQQPMPLPPSLGIGEPANLLHSAGRGGGGSAVRRTVDFSTGGELFKMSVGARDLSMSIDI